MARRRRRPLRRAAMVGGVSYGAAPGREGALPAPAAAPSEGAVDQLDQLNEAGVLTQDELDDRRRRLRQGA